ncbi:hypothetical protein BHE74_00000781 [Ensete ventricosum]|nr:hypothetical protein BHE74_00000781 [Ensete ventricosum]
MDYPIAILRLGMTREWADEGQLLKKRTQSEVAEALLCRYDRSNWRVGRLQCLYSFKGARGRTFVELSIPCSHGGRVLVVKGVEEVENVEAKSKSKTRLKGRGQGTL